jgi:hypothetical protein
MTNVSIKNTVAEPIAAYNAMAQHWALIDDLMGGTLAMRAAGETWLPKEPEELVTGYNIRLNRSVLFGAYKDTVKNLASKPFAKPVTIQGDVPEKLADIAGNVDGEGTSLTQYARQLFASVMNRGLTHVLVDYPTTIVGEDGAHRPLSVAEEKSRGLRPYFVHIRPEQLIGWKTETVNGSPKLTEIRWKETRTKPDGAYGVKTTDAIRVYTTVGWELHEMVDDKGDYVLVESGVHNYPEGIPLVTMYIEKTGFMTGEPPLEDLAWTNLAHWQSDSDQRNILRYSRTALLFVKGETSDEIASTKITVGPNRTIRTTNPDADCKYVEHSGAAIGSGREDLRSLEERMEVLGLQPMLQRSGGVTATANAIDESRSQCSMQAWVRSIEAGLRECYRVAAVWVKVELPENFGVDIFNDFALSLRASQDIEALIKIRQAGEMSRDTFLREIKRRAILSETVDVDEEMERIEAEGPALGTIGKGDGE